MRAFGAVQAQDYAGALWGIGQRTKDATIDDVERAIAERAIVRTWPMRGTLHFVAPEDVRWMLRFLVPRVIARTAGRHRQLALDAAQIAKARARLEKVLAGGRSLTRPQAYAEIERAGVSPEGQRGIHILAHLAMHGVLCFGPRSGKQPTFVLLDEWIPNSRMLERDEALSELATRYFASHGPATTEDFAWWAGLPMGDARRAVEAAPKSKPARKSVAKNVVHLLPAYDELTVAYRDRSASLDPAHAEHTRNGIFSPVVAVDGRIVGTWKRSTRRDRVIVDVELLVPMRAPQREALERAAERYGEFLGTRAEVRVTRRALR